MLIAHTVFAGRYTHFSKFKTVIEGVIENFTIYMQDSLTDRGRGEKKEGN